MSTIYEYNVDGWKDKDRELIEGIREVRMTVLPVRVLPKWYLTYLGEKREPHITDIYIGKTFSPNG